MADFGHAKHFFPDADVFPSVIVLRKPAPGEPAQGDTRVCVIPRDAVPEKGLVLADPPADVGAGGADALRVLPRRDAGKRWSRESGQVR